MISASFVRRVWTLLEIKCFCGASGSRFGGKVRDHVGQGYGKISQCLCTNIFCNAETPCPRASCVRVFECEVRVFECELSTYLVCRGLTSPGLREALCHSPNITNQVRNQSPHHTAHWASRAYTLSWPECGYFSNTSSGLGLRCNDRQVFSPSARYQAGGR